MNGFFESLAKFMKIRLHSIALLLSLVSLAFCGRAIHADELGQPIQYVLQEQTQYFYRSNPFLAESGSPRKSANMVWLHGVRGAVVVPLGSERTRLELAGSYGKLSYNREKLLDYHPYHGLVRLPWQAGNLWVGNIEFEQDASEYRWLDRTWPQGDTLSTGRRYANLGLRLTDSLTAPILTFGQSDIRYRQQINHSFDQHANWTQISGRYQGVGRSLAQFGLRDTNGLYLHRLDALAEVLGRRFKEHKIYFDVTWDLSEKTVIGAHLDWSPRRYLDVWERDATLWNVEGRAGWDYSVKTRFDGRIWHQSYPNDRDIDVLYSTYTGVQVTMRWEASPKTFASLSAVHELQDDTLPNGDGTLSRVTRSNRLGARVEWSVGPRVAVVLDAWRNQVGGRHGRSSYTDNMLRVSLVFGYGNGVGSPERLLWTPECEPPRYVEAYACQPVVQPSVHGRSGWGRY